MLRKVAKPWGRAAPLLLQHRRMTVPPGQSFPRPVGEDEARYHPTADNSAYVPEASFREEVALKLHEKHGQGNYELHRSLYVELCDEMRREVYAKPPAPMNDWQAHHEPGKSTVYFERLPQKEGDGYLCAWADLKLHDPKQLNETLTFLNWYPVELCIVRGEFVMHLHVAVGEGQLNYRNVRIYHDPSQELAVGRGENPAYVRKHLRYDGPFQGHLELDFQTELFDVMMDHGVIPDTVRYFGEWVAHLEHVEYARWLLKMLEMTIPGGVEKETDLLMREERDELDLAVEDWLPVKEM